MKNSEHAYLEERIRLLITTDKTEQDSQDTIIKEIAAKRTRALSLLLFYWIDSYELPDSSQIREQQELMERALRAVYQNDPHNLRDTWQKLQMLLTRTGNQNSNRMVNGDT